MRAAAESSDGALLSAAGRGDGQAFTRLVERHKDALVGYLGRLTGDRERAEELAQETFVRLYEHRDRYEERGKLQGYLYRIATNLVRGEARSQARRRLLRLRFFDSNGHLEASQPASLLREELRQRVARAVIRLPLRYRVPIVLSQIEGWSYRDIGRALGCREGTVKSRVFRAKRLLEKELAPYWAGGGQ